MSLELAALGLRRGQLWGCGGPCARVCADELRLLGSVPRREGLYAAAKTRRVCARVTGLVAGSNQISMGSRAANLHCTAALMKRLAVA